MASRHKELRLTALKFGQVLTLKEVYVKQAVRKKKFVWYLYVCHKMAMVYFYPCFYPNCFSDILGFKLYCSISFGNDMNMKLQFCMDIVKTGLTCHEFCRYPSSKDLHLQWIIKKKSFFILTNQQNYFPINLWWFMIPQNCDLLGFFFNAI